VKILVADDDATSRAILAKALQAVGHEAVIARDGTQAWEAFVSEDVECVVTDWMMPGLSGPDLCRRVRAHGDRSWSYLLLLTAKEANADLVEGLLAGADEFMSKPFDVDVLRARLHVAQRVLGLERSLRTRVAELEEALAEVKTLRGLLPICMYCKKVRDEREAWQAVEEYVAKRSDAQFSHGVCPGCWDSVVKPMISDLRSRTPAHLCKTPLSIDGPAAPPKA
jgi:phosphoserine phosphatase RsbU/P